MEIPHEEENFFRVSKLVYKEIPAQLRSFFKDKWKCKYNLDWDDSPTSGDTLLKKIPSKTKSYLKKETRDKFKEGSSQEWDCSTLFQVLLYAGLKLVDANERKQIDCLREVRNKQCSHLADSQISDNEKATIFTEVAEVYDELNWMKDKLRSIEQDVFITADLKEVKWKPEEEKRADLASSFKRHCKDRLEKCQRPYFQVQGNKLTTKFSRQQRCKEWVPISLTEVNTNHLKSNEGLIKQSVQSPTNLKQVIQEVAEAKLNFLSGPLGIDLLTQVKEDCKTCLEESPRTYNELYRERQQDSKESMPVSYYIGVQKEKFIGNGGLMEQTLESSIIDLERIIDKEAKLNFLSGPPGIGKSSLLDYAVLSWAEDRLFNGENGCKFEVVLRFKCCDLVRYRGQKITKEELLEKSFGKREYASLLKKVDSKDVLIILDGIDQFYAVDKLFTDKADDEMTYLVQDLIKPDSALSCGHNVLVSGRPYAIQILDEKAGKLGKGRHVEIHGFARDGIGEFIRKFAGDDHDLNEYITGRIKESLTLKMCSEIPLFLHQICYILKAEKEECKTFQQETVTDICTMLFCLLIKFHCRSGIRDFSDMELHKLLKEKHIMAFLKILAEISWNLLKQSRILLDDKEIEEIRETDPITQGLIEGFLLKIPNELENSFQMVHFNMQAFLAAIHCVKSNMDPQELLDGKHDPEHDEVLKLMAGFTVAAVKPTSGNKKDRKEVKPLSKLKLLILGDITLGTRRKREKEERRNTFIPVFIFSFIIAFFLLALVPRVC